MLSYIDRTPLKIATAGSVDDSLKEEREKDIISDVVYRYLNGTRRRLVVADCPAPIECTRNMVSGCVDAHVLVILVDIARGMTEQTRRHLAVAQLFQAQSVIVCINEMDRVDYAERHYAPLQRELAVYCQQLGLSDVQFVPISALHGENLSLTSEAMPWYKGAPLLSLLEEGDLVEAEGFRVIVQGVQVAKLRPYHSIFVESGVLRQGDPCALVNAGATDFD